MTSKEITVKIRTYAKAIVAAAGSLAVALSDGHLSLTESCLVVVAVGAVYGIRNEAPDQR